MPSSTRCLLAATSFFTLALAAPSASATGFLCGPTTQTPGGGSTTQCLLFVYEGGNAVCVGGRRDVVPDGDTHPDDVYECFLDSTPLSS